MWRSVFLHEFIDHRIGNFQALPGTATPSSLTITPGSDTVPGVNSVAIAPGAGFEYVLAQPLPQVIGFSCRVRLMYPINPQPTLFPVVRLGAGAELLFWPDTHPVPDLTGTMANVRVWVANGFKNLGRIALPARTFTDFRLDWHTSGQLRVLANGRLVAYHNAVAPGASFAVDRVVFGMPQTQPSPQPLYRVARVFVRALERSDSLALFSRLLPAVDAPSDDVNRCRLRVIANLLAIVDRLRTFMTSAHQAMSRPWTQENGPATGPFSPEATEAHALATASVAELSRMLRTGDFSAPDRFLDPFSAFLRILHTALPGQFETLAAELATSPAVPEECRAVLEPTYEKNKDALGPVVDLLSAAADRLRHIAGGN
jgi:hypothetical protein